MRLDYSTDQRVWDLLDENERLRVALRAAGLAPSVVAAIAEDEPPRPCPAGHGAQCCGYPAACEAALTLRRPTVAEHSEKRGTPPKRRYSLNLAMQGDGPQAMADALYNIATDLLHGSFPGLQHRRGYDVAYRAELIENDPTMTHERYVEELEAYLSGSKVEETP